MQATGAQFKVTGDPCQVGEASSSLFSLFPRLQACEETSASTASFQGASRDLLNPCLS